MEARRVDAPRDAAPVLAGYHLTRDPVEGWGRDGDVVAYLAEHDGAVDDQGGETLHAIIEGRATPPTDAELAAHAERGALWMVAHERGDIFATMMSWPSSRDWHVGKGATRWWPFTIDGRPCAWPTAPQRPAGCICDFRGGLHRFSCLRQQMTVAVTRDEDGTFRVAGKDNDDGF